MPVIASSVVPETVRSGELKCDGNVRDICGLKGVYRSGRFGVLNPRVTLKGVDLRNSNFVAVRLERGLGSSDCSDMLRTVTTQEPNCGALRDLTRLDCSIDTRLRVDLG